MNDRDDPLLNGATITFSFVRKF